LIQLSTGVEQQVKAAIPILKQGGLVAFPTDTVYGLGACFNLPQSVERIYAIKERPRHMPLPLLLADVAEIAEFAESIPPVGRLLIRHFLPGALTLVLLKSSAVPDFITAGSATVALRVPAHPVPVALAKGLGVPIVGTSANLSGMPSPLTATEVYAQLGKRVDLIIDGGRCPGGKESSIVDVTGATSVILREGAIARAELERVCGRVILAQEAR